MNPSLLSHVLNSSTLFILSSALIIILKHLLLRSLEPQNIICFLQFLPYFSFLQQWTLLLTSSSLKLTFLFGFHNTFLSVPHHHYFSFWFLLFVFTSFKMLVSSLPQVPTSVAALILQVFSELLSVFSWLQVPPYANNFTLENQTCISNWLSHISTFLIT